MAGYSKKILEIEENELDDFIVIEQGIETSRAVVRKLRKLLSGRDFKNSEDEIHFFKVQKPFVYGRIMFFLTIYNYQLRKSKGSLKLQKNDIDAKIKSLQKDYLKDFDFIKYYRKNSNKLDNIYFLRGKEECRLLATDCSFSLDEEFSTSHDTSVAKIIAYDLLLSYYMKELDNLKKSNQEDNPVKRHFKSLNLGWTANKIDLIELIYALQASGAIKGGKAGIKDMAIACEQIFDIDLGNYYRKFLEIRGRKIEPTKFLDRMKLALLKRIEEADE